MNGQLCLFGTWQSEAEEHLAHIMRHIESRKDLDLLQSFFKMWYLTKLEDLKGDV